MLDLSQARDFNGKAVPYEDVIKAAPYAVYFARPRPWGERAVHYLVIIDHCTMFVIPEPAHGPTSEIACDGLRRWVGVFGAPERVLTDRGAGVVAGSFKELVLKEFAANVIFRSPYFPQGNGISEAAHQGLDHSLKTAESRCADESLEQALGDALVVHNATHSTATEISSFCLLLGFEMILPGWQYYRETDKP